MGAIPSLVYSLSVRYLSMLRECRSLMEVSSRFFTFIFVLNSVGLLLCATGYWTYPRDYTGAFILGNLLLSIVVRNELFARFLYLTFNFLFAKVRLLSIVLSPDAHHVLLLVVSALASTSSHIDFATSWRRSFWLCYVRPYVAHIQSGHYNH